MEGSQPEQRAAVASSDSAAQQRKSQRPASLLLQRRRSRNKPYLVARRQRDYLRLQPRTHSRNRRLLADEFRARDSAGAANTSAPRTVRAPAGHDRTNA